MADSLDHENLSYSARSVLTPFYVTHVSISLQYRLIYKIQIFILTECAVSWELRSLHCDPDFFDEFLDSNRSIQVQWHRMQNRFIQ